MKAPTTYFEWKEAMDSFSKGDDSVLPFMNEGKMTLDAGTVDRFTKLFENTYKIRKQIWLEKFNNISKHHNIRSTSDFSVVIGVIKKDLKNLISFSQLRPFSPEIRNVFKNDLKIVVDQTKKSLRENAMRDRSNNLNSMLVAFENLDLEKLVDNNPSPPQDPPAGGRKIIF